MTMRIDVERNESPPSLAGCSDDELVARARELIHLASAHTMDWDDAEYYVPQIIHVMDEMTERFSRRVVRSDVVEGRA